MNFPKVGEILPNGHTVDAAYCVGDSRYVLAHRDGEWEQFVVWRVDQDGDTVNGRYFDDPVAAQKKFAECCFDWWDDLSAEYPQIVSDDRQTILESTMGQIRPILQKALLKYGIPNAVSADNPGAEKEGSFDLIQMYTSCKAPQKNEEQIKVDFCCLFLSKLKKMRGEDLAPHLADVIFNKRERRTYMRLWF